MNAPPPVARARGFSLIEVLVAMAMLAFLMSAVASNSGTSLENSSEVFSVTNASQLMESIVLDIEEEYRIDGFPTNQLEGRECEVPRGFEDMFECEYDLLSLELGTDNIGSLGAEANESIASSPLMSAFCGGGPQGGQPVDPAIALAALATQPDIGALAAFKALLDPGFNQICGINLEKMCQNTQLITSFIPTIIEQAALSTRKLVVRLTWGGPDRAAWQKMEIETFITAVPEAEPEAP
ncbi:MAG: type II secretion system protein [Deltaproteobacteria bacterium]|nr:type II secretion system protein [Deltaproteobacteria bacterium]